MCRSMKETAAGIESASGAWNFGAVHDVRLVGAREPPGLNPGVGEMGEAVLSKEQHTAHRGHCASLMPGA